MNHTERASHLHRTAEELGILHYVLAYLDWDCGLRPQEVLADLLATLEHSGSTWPGLSPLLRESVDMGRLCEEHRARSSWSHFHGEFGDWIRQRYGLEDSPAWRALLQAQTAIMPAAGRVFPDALKLEHDVVAWFIARCRYGYDCCSLESQPPGRLVVRDPWGLSSAWCADRVRTRSSRWELDSALSEARCSYQQMPASYSRSA